MGFWKLTSGMGKKGGEADACMFRHKIFAGETC